MTKIVCLAPQTRADRVEQLRAQFPAVEFVIPSPRADAINHVADADAFFGNPTNDEYQAAQKLRWIQAQSAGVEFIEKVPALRDDAVVVTNMRGAHAATIAETAFAMLLTMTRGLKLYQEFQDREEWGRGQLSDRVIGIKGLTMGIIGFGNIGRAIARRAHGFEMNVLAVDAQPVPPNEHVSEVWPLSRLDEMCEKSDVLVISCPVTPETRGMVGAKQIQKMQRGSHLLAMSRGGIVQEVPLIDALETGHLAGAGLDVTAVEPLPAGDPLWKATNVIVTPHTSAASALTSDLVWSMFATNIEHFIKGEPLENTVDKQAGY
ncbi:MAG: D-2-hydroxyacid dehydrogenase [Chloroflexota bacterium]